MEGRRVFNDALTRPLRLQLRPTQFSGRFKSRGWIGARPGGTGTLSFGPSSSLPVLAPLHAEGKNVVFSIAGS